jgi:hypothetical protein
MDTPFTVTLRRFKAISALESEEEASIQAATSGALGYQYGSPRADEYQSEPRPCQAALRAFLKALPVSHVFALAALMYAGRDGKDDPASYWADVKVSFGTKEDATRALVEKAPRVEYIDRVLHKVAGVDELPARVARA